VQNIFRTFSRILFQKPATKDQGIVKKLPFGPIKDKKKVVVNV
jgi:hypothetical protein